MIVIHTFLIDCYYVSQWINIQSFLLLFVDNFLISVIAKHSVRLSLAFERYSDSNQGYISVRWFSEKQRNLSPTFVYKAPEVFYCGSSLESLFHLAWKWMIIIQKCMTKGDFSFNIALSRGKNNVRKLR